ncbi:MULTISPECIES: hypothetical protein [unclassified Pseudomonas]|nr:MULTISPECIES: hypothetical protein [unclassified Pseudomonas]MCU1740625.1 hypothetical protein [Pseudomonas sp. 20S_6.2_Bac1]
MIGAEVTAVGAALANVLSNVALMPKTQAAVAGKARDMLYLNA